VDAALRDYPSSGAKSHSSKFRGRVNGQDHGRVPGVILDTGRPVMGGLGWGHFLSANTLSNS
jgi:hypothetical protein